MSGRPRVAVTRRLPAAVEEQLAREFDTQLNRDDRPLDAAGLQQALRTPAHIYGFVQTIPELMRAADVVVTKGGPQTIAESLNTKCAGRSWVFVTSQEDMEKVIGDRTRQQGNDFSKIQARFQTRVKLTSADVEEVIRKRLLEKNGAGEAALAAIYAAESPNFKTLFDFVDARAARGASTV